MAAALAPPARLESEVTERPIEHSEDGFVSSDTCRSCHPREHATWHDSYHRTMTQLVKPGTVLGDFAGVELELRGQRYRLDHRGGQPWVEMPDPARPEGPPARYPLVLSTGSHHMQVYWYPTGESRILGQMPFIWLVGERRWAPRNSVFLMPPPDSLSEARRWNLTCSKCHTTQPRPRVGGAGELDTRVAE